MEQINAILSKGLHFVEDNRIIKNHLTGLWIVQVNRFGRLPRLGGRIIVDFSPASTEKERQP